jgi:hypothetical protein
MRKLPEGPLGLTGITLFGDVKISANPDCLVTIFMGVSPPYKISPAAARQFAEWLQFFADEVDAEQARRLR